MILDRDTKYTAEFRRMIAESGTAVIRRPPRSPKLNAFAERFVRSIKDECLNRMIFVGLESLRRAVREYLAHYRCEQNHQGLGNRLLIPIENIGSQSGSVRKRERLGGMLNYYDRRTALKRVRPGNWTLRPPSGNPGTRRRYRVRSRSI